MTRRTSKPAHSTKTHSHEKRENTSVSAGAITIAKTELKKFESQADEGFLIRAEMDRKLSSF